MTPDPELAPGGKASQSSPGKRRGPAGRVPGRRVRPEPTGVVLASQFDDVPASDRARLRVDKVPLEVPPAYQAVPAIQPPPGQPRPTWW